MWHKKITEDCFLYMFPVLMRTRRNSWGWWPVCYLSQFFCTLKAISECIVHKPEALHRFLSNYMNSAYIFSIIPGNLGQRNLNTLCNCIYRLSEITLIVLFFNLRIGERLQTYIRYIITVNYTINWNKTFIVLIKLLFLWNKNIFPPPAFFLFLCIFSSNYGLTMLGGVSKNVSIKVGI